MVNEFRFPRGYNHVFADKMKHEIGIRVRVLRPLKGVAMQVQRGKNELLPPSKDDDSELVFEFPISVDMSAEQPNFLGVYAHGPKEARFIYVNSGTYAGQHHTCWSRRAKLSLMTVTKEQVEEVLNNGGRLEASFAGTGSDGGPTCASVKGIEWKVTKK